MCRRHANGFLSITKNPLEAHFLLHKDISRLQSLLLINDLPSTTGIFFLNNMDLGLLHCLYTNYQCKWQMNHFILFMFLFSTAEIIFLTSNVHATRSKETKAFLPDRLGDYHYCCVIMHPFK